jgi:hypothetical protein
LPPPQPLALAAVVCALSSPRRPVLFQLAAPPKTGRRCAAEQLAPGS